MRWQCQRTRRTIQKRTDFFIALSVQNDATALVGLGSSNGRFVVGYPYPRPAPRIKTRLKAETILYEKITLVNTQITNHKNEDRYARLFLSLICGPRSFLKIKCIYYRIISCHCMLLYVVA